MKTQLNILLGGLGLFALQGCKAPQAEQSVQPNVNTTDSRAKSFKRGIPLNCNSSRPISSLREDAVCVSDVFCNAGYDCAYFGKLHADFPTPNDPERPGQNHSSVGYAPGHSESSLSRENLPGPRTPSPGYGIGREKRK